MKFEAWSVFIAASLLLALTPGPDILAVITRSISQGTRAGLAAALGFASGLTVHTALAAAGIAAIINASPHAMLALRWIGAIYLLYLAVRIFLHRDPINLRAGGQNSRRNLFAVYGQSVLMNVLNPKVTLFFLGFLPGFVDPAAATPPWVQSISLGIVFALCTVICFGSCALFAGTISGWVRRQPAASDWLRRATVAVFVAIAVWIAIT